MSFKTFIVVLTMGFVFGYWVGTAQSATLSEYASEISGQRVNVHCVYSRYRLGYTFQYQDQTGSHFQPDIYLSRGTCRGVRGLLAHNIYDTRYQADALTTIVHEAYHIRLNSENESLVECVMLKNIWNYITDLGFEGRVNKQLYIEAWNSHWGLPDEYVQLGYGCNHSPFPEGTIAFGPVEKP